MHGVKFAARPKALTGYTNKISRNRIAIRAEQMSKFSLKASLPVCTVLRLTIFPKQGLFARVCPQNLTISPS